MLIYNQVYFDFRSQVGVNNLASIYSGPILRGSGRINCFSLLDTQVKSTSKFKLISE